MTRRRKAAIVILSGVGGLFLGAAALAQTSGGVYDLSWRTLSGGGSSSGGGYVQQSAIGQAMTKTSTGGSYTISSGFFGAGQDKYKRFLPVLSKD
jgi:hypothetical protein